MGWLRFCDAGLVKFGKFEPAMKYAISQTDIFEDLAVLVSLAVMTDVVV